MRGTYDDVLYFEDIFTDAELAWIKGDDSVSAKTEILSGLCINAEDIFEKPFGGYELPDEDPLSQQLPIDIDSDLSVDGTENWKLNSILNENDSSSRLKCRDWTVLDEHSYYSKTKILKKTEDKSISHIQRKKLSKDFIKIRKYFVDKCTDCNREQENIGDTVSENCDICQADILYECIFCRKTCKDLHDIQLHIMNEHIKLNEKPWESSEERTFCSKCKRGYSLSFYLKVHRLCCTSERYLKCRICTYSTNQSKNLQCHMMRSHADAYTEKELCDLFYQIVKDSPTLKENDDYEQLTKCRWCEKKLKTGREREKHETDCRRISTRYECTVCHSYRSSKKSSITAHMTKCHESLLEKSAAKLSTIKRDRQMKTSTYHRRLTWTRKQVDGYCERCKKVIFQAGERFGRKCIKCCDNVSAQCRMCKKVYRLKMYAYSHVTNVCGKDILQELLSEPQRDYSADSMDTSNIENDEPIMVDGNSRVFENSNDLEYSKYLDKCDLIIPDVLSDYLVDNQM